MKSLTGDRLALIDALVAETELGGVRAALLEKGERFSDALRALFALPFAGSVVEPLIRVTVIVADRVQALQD